MTHSQKVMDDLPPGGWCTFTEVPLTLFPKASVTLAVPSATRLTSPTTPAPAIVETELTKGEFKIFFLEYINTFLENVDLFYRNPRKT